jgi:hypothetical protein
MQQGALRVVLLLLILQQCMAVGFLFGDQASCSHFISSSIVARAPPAARLTCNDLQQRAPLLQPTLSGVVLFVLQGVAARGFLPTGYPG